jgi:hypothetical protein
MVDQLCHRIDRKARMNNEADGPPLAPDFAWTMIGWCQISASLSVTMRIAMSAIPPAG